MSWILDEWGEAVKLDSNAETDSKRSDDHRFWSCVAKRAETRYVLQRDGWNLFIEQSGFDPTRIRVMPGHWMLEHVDENSRVQPDAAEALRRRTKQVEPYTLKTPEDFARDWLQIVEEITGV